MNDGDDGVDDDDGGDVLKLSKKELKKNNCLYLLRNF